MNEAYRQLADDLPPRAAPRAGGFPSDPKRMKAWIEALPRANPAQVQQQVAAALEAMNALRLEGGQRLATLELLRPVALEAIVALRRLVQGASFPLPPAKARAMEQLQAFEDGLALGYRLATVEACAPAGAIPMLRGAAVAQALERALLHRSRAMMLAFARYRTPEPGSWKSLHAAYRFARSHRLDERAVDDGAEPGSTTARQVYARTLLLALSNPYRFSLNEQSELWSVARGLATQIVLQPQRSAESLPIPLDGDEGPGYIPEERAEDRGELLWLDLAPLRQVLEQPLADTVSGAVRIRLRGGGVVDSSAELLRRLRAGWGQLAARTSKRLTAEHLLDTVLGLSSVHFHLADGRDFETFVRQNPLARPGHGPDRHDWAHSGADAARFPVFSAAALDQSLGGYRIRWPAEQQVKARVGELVGISPSGDDDTRRWMLGIVRWLRHAGDGSVDAGIELLARRARPVAVRSLDPPADGRPTLRGIQFEPARGGGSDPLSLQMVVPSLLDLVGGAVEVRRAADELPFYAADTALHARCRHARVLENAGEFMIVQAACDEACA
jgi:cyclic-di-GMP-binding protein